MTKIKLADGTIVNASDVVLEKGILKITTSENTVEELAGIFSNKENTSIITLMTESGKECGYKKGFTSFAGIIYDSEGNKTVEMFQPKDVTEQRISNAESIISEVSQRTASLEEQNMMLIECVLEMSEQVYA